MGLDLVQSRTWPNCSLKVWQCLNCTRGILIDELASNWYVKTLKECCKNKERRDPEARIVHLSSAHLNSKHSRPSLCCNLVPTMLLLLRLVVERVLTARQSKWLFGTEMFLLNLLQQIKVHIRQSKSEQCGLEHGEAKYHQIAHRHSCTVWMVSWCLMHLVMKARLLSGLIWMANEESKVQSPKPGVHFQWAYWFSLCPIHFLGCYYIMESWISN